MIRKIGVFTTVLLTIALVFNAGVARATPVNIINAGFEDPILADDVWTEVAPPGWTQIGSPTGYVGAWHVTTGDFISAPQGQNVAYTETRRYGTSWVGLEQILDTPFGAGKNYTLTVEVGNSGGESDPYFSGYKVQLLAGETVIAEDDNTLHPDWFKWDTSTVEYIYDPLNFNNSLKGLLGIRLINLGHDPEGGREYLVGVEFDDVRLENDNTIPTPEPATMLLLGTGLLGLAGFGRKKLFRK